MDMLNSSFRRGQLNSGFGEARRGRWQAPRFSVNKVAGRVTEKRRQGHDGTSQLIVGTQSAGSGCAVVQACAASGIFGSDRHSGCRPARRVRPCRDDDTQEVVAQLVHRCRRWGAPRTALRVVAASHRQPALPGRLACRRVHLAYSCQLRGRGPASRAGIACGRQFDHPPHMPPCARLRCSPRQRSPRQATPDGQQPFVALGLNDAAHEVGGPPPGPTP